MKKTVEVNQQLQENLRNLKSLQVCLSRMGLPQNPHLSMSYDRAFLGENSSKKNLIAYVFEADQKQRTLDPTNPLRIAKIKVEAAYDCQKHDVIPSTVPLMMGESINDFDMIKIYHKDFNDKDFTCKFAFDKNVTN